MLSHDEKYSIRKVWLYRGKAISEVYTGMFSAPSVLLILEKLDHYDATFMIAYIGLSAAMVALSLTLLALLAVGAEFGALHVTAALLNLIGWSVLPFAPRLYQSLIGHRFSWRTNAALGDIEL